jgi:hypothetical protein
LFGRALIRSKLEEATKLQATMSEKSFKDAKCSYVYASNVSDKWMGDIIYFWRYHLSNAKSKSWKKLRKIMILCTLWLAE